MASTSESPKSSGVRWFAVALLVVSVGVLAGLLVWPTGSAPGPNGADPERAGEPGAARSGSAPAGPAAELGETWRATFANGRRMGFSHTTWERESTDEGTLLHGRQDERMVLKRFDQTVRMRATLRTTETEEGGLRSFRFTLRNPPAGATRTRGIVEDDELRLTTVLAGKESTKTLPWKAGTKSLLWLERTLRRNPLGAGESRSFETYVPELNQIGRVTLRAGEQRVSKELLDGTTKELLPVRIERSGLPIPSTAWVDEEGRDWVSEQEVFGVTMTSYVVDEQEALRSLAGSEPLDVAVNTMVPVRPIANAHASRRAVYRVSLPGDDPAQYVVEGGTQEVRRIDAETIELTVREAGAVEASGTGEPPGGEYLAPSPYVQSDDPGVVALAEEGAAGVESPRDTAVALEGFVHGSLSKRDFSTALASAAEVAESRQGDCTEHAVLLAALLRARGIPSRVAVGLVYVPGEEAFSGHMWTEAWVEGRWLPLDAMLGRGGIGAAHVKLGQSAFAEDAAAPSLFVPLLKTLGRIELEVVEVDG